MAASGTAVVPDGRLIVFWRVLRANPLSFFGFLLVAVIGITAVIVLVAPGLIIPYAPLQETAARNAAPSAQHLFGTDNLGRSSNSIRKNSSFALAVLKKA